MIFQALPEHIPLCVPLATEYTDIIPSMKFNPTHWVDFWQSQLKAGSGVVFLAENDGIVGGIGGIKYPCPLSGRMTAVEMFWYVTEKSRREGILLYKYFKNWARENGCERIAMIYLPCSMPEKLKRFYEREGLTLIEMHYEGTL